jgi:hypothetical protein
LCRFLRQFCCSGNSEIGSKEYVVANTGTEFDVDKLRDLALTDAQMALLKVNQQLDDARLIVELALEVAQQDCTPITFQKKLMA